ncbi:hypothetical protein BDV06DRAFT_221257 [Aspergillus oleicola]
MVVRIRLARFGNKHQPFYNIVVAQARYGPSGHVSSARGSFWNLPLVQPGFHRQIGYAIEIFELTHFPWCRSARNSKPLEVIGTLNPVPQRPTNLSEEEAESARPYKDITLDRSRAKYWLGVGAQPSSSVWRLLNLAGLVQGQQEAPK